MCTSVSIFFELFKQGGTSTFYILLFLCLMEVRIPEVIQGFLDILNCLRLNIFLGQHEFVKSLNILIRLLRLQLCSISGLLSSSFNFDKNNSMFS